MKKYNKCFKLARETPPTIEGLRKTLMLNSIGLFLFFKEFNSKNCKEKK